MSSGDYLLVPRELTAKRDAFSAHPKGPPVGRLFVP